MQERTKERNVRARDCVTAVQKTTEKNKCKSRFDLIFVEGVNVIFSSTFVNPSTCYRGTSQVMDSSCFKSAS